MFPLLLIAPKPSIAPACRAERNRAWITGYVHGAHDRKPDENKGSFFSCSSSGLDENIKTPGSYIEREQHRGKAERAHAFVALTRRWKAR
jgi:hypothetical protein